MTQKIKDLLFKAKTYWKKPPRGYQVCIREFVDLALGAGGVSFLSVIVTFTSVATSVNIMVSYFGLTTGLAWLLGIIGSLIALVRAPILSLIIDNSRSSRGKFKPFLMWSTLCAAVCFTIIPFTPEILNDRVAFSFQMFSIPALNIQAETVDVSVGIIVVFALNQAGTFFHTLMTQCMTGVEQTISTVAQERANIAALKGLISNIPASVVNALIPVLAGAFFTDPSLSDSVNGYNNINLYRWVFPFCAVGAVLFMWFTVRGTQERAVVKHVNKQKTGFLKSVWQLTSNKYFWIINIFNIAVSIRAYANITTWITQYTYASGIGKMLVGLYCTTLLMNVFIIGMLAGPPLIRKFGKRNVMLVSGAAYTVAIGLQFIAYNQPIIILLTQLLQNTAGGFAYIATVMVSDALDYQQYKTGKRVEGTWQNYAAVITTVAGVFTSFLVPVFLQFAGVKFSDNIAEKLQIEEMRYQIYKYQTLLALIASVFCVIPMIFYDLSEKKHADIIKVLKIRAAIANFKDGVLQEEDVLSVKDIVTGNAGKTTGIVAQELASEDAVKYLDEILKDYDKVKEEYDLRVREEAKGDFLRECEIEFKRIENAHERAEKKAAKKGGTYERESRHARLMEGQRYLKYLGKGELAAFYTMQDLVNDTETAYSAFEKIWKEDAALKLEQGVSAEEKVLQERITKARAAAEKKGKQFDERAFTEKFVSRSRYLRRSKKYGGEE